MLAAYLPAGQTVTDVLNQRHFRCLEPGPFRFIMVAYNLISLFRHFALNSHNQASLRSYCFVIGAWVRHHARKRVLKLSLPRQKRPWLDSIFQHIEARPPPFAYPTA
jgi:hypothetical protein